MLTHAQLLQFLSYDPETGDFRLLTNMGRRQKGDRINYEILHLARPGATRRRVSRIMIVNQIFSTGRLAWFYMKGAWPRHEIDHADGDGWNNRWSNLREATRSQNQANTRRYRSNKSGFKGVFLTRNKKPWRAQIQKNGRRISLGHFETKEEAFAEYLRASRELHGAFARAA